MKSLSLSLLLLFSISSFATPWDIKTTKFKSKSAWDKPLEYKSKAFMPEIYVTPVTIIDEYNVVVRIILTEVDFVRTWRALMEANAVQWTGTRFEPVIFHYEFDVPAGYMVYDFPVTFTRPTSWVTWPGTPYAVLDDEFYVYEFFPIN